MHRTARASLYRAAVWFKLGLFDSSESSAGAHGSTSWEDATQRWLEERMDKASIQCDRSTIRWLACHLNGMPLHMINRAVIDSLTKKKLSEGASNATVNRMLALVRAILNRAVSDWEWLRFAPKVRLLREPMRRIRYLSKAQAMRLLQELPSHLSDMAAFSLATGLRRSNVTGLEWSQIDLNRRLAWVHPDQAKARRAIAVPLNDDAMAVLADQRGKHQKYVFTYKGRRITQVTTAAWYKALKRAGISDLGAALLRDSAIRWRNG